MNLKNKNFKNSSKGISARHTSSVGSRTATAGITLIALVITIIVLLILAGVTIASLTGENGILTRAQTSRDKTEDATVEEKVKLAVQASYTEGKGIIDRDDLDKELKDLFGAGKYEISEGDAPWTVTVEDYEATVNSKGKVAKTEEKDPDDQDPPPTGVVPGVRVTETKVDNYTDGTENEINTATVPAGFTVSNIAREKIVDDGLVIYDIPAADLPIANWEADNDGNGIIDVQEKYNQFVWVPVSRTNFETEFVREHFGTSGQKWWTGTFVKDKPSTNNMYEPTPDSTAGTTAETATEVTKMYTSVETNGGFYIARYEAGTTATGSGARGVPESKRGMTVYNNIGWNSDGTMTGDTSEKGGAVEVSRQMYEGKSTLCYGVQWDAIMRWISNDEDLAGYLTNSSGKGNYSDSDITNNPAKTGAVENYQFKNIFDLAGNVYEWTMEAYDTYSRDNRGGDYGDFAGYYPVSGRHGYGPGDSRSRIGFRPALFV